MAGSLWGLAWRESRTARRRLLLYMSSISFGVAALVAIDSFSENVTRSIHEQSRALTGGDLSVSSRRGAFPARAIALMDSLDRSGVRFARQTSMPSMAFIPRTGETRLVLVRAITRGYPLYGEITSTPRSAWQTLHDGANVVVDPALLVTLQAVVGDTVQLGNARFKITGALEKVPGDIGIAAAMGPRVYIPEPLLEQTGLLVFGSRAEYEAVASMPASMSTDRFMRTFGTRFREDSLRVRTAGFSEDRLADNVEDLATFLGIVALVALLLGGIGVASGVHAFVVAKVDTVAILRCLGATGNQVLFIYVSQAAIMGLIGALAGAALGLIAQFVMPRVLGDFLPLDVTVHAEPVAIALGVGVGVWVALVFALRPLVSLRRVSPLQALRRDTSAAVSGGRDSLSMVLTFALIGSVLALTLSRADSFERGLGYAAAIGGAIAVLLAAATVASRSARRFARPGIPFAIRQGIGALYRPANQTRSVVLALGFGVFLVSTLYQVQRNLLRTFGLKLDESRANVVFIDVQSDQRAGVDSIIRAQGREIVGTTPIVRMRIDSINGQAGNRARTQAGETVRRSGWALRREYNSTSRDSLGSAEKITAGTWFGPTPLPGELPEISVEQDVANDLELGLGDTVTWNVQGVRIRTRVTSLREVTWASFQPNFFVIFQPGALDGAPTQYVILANAPTPADVATLQRATVSRYPTVSSIDLTLVQRTVGDVIGKATTAIRFLAFLSIGLAIPVLFSAVAATRRQRVREGVLLKVLGATRRQIGRILFAEYAVLGVLGALCGALLSIGAAWALAHWIFHIVYVPVIPPILAITAGVTLLAVAIGFLTGREVFRETPMTALRDA
jgi:putative ABC transport system permease protein